jgi:hypothetical protein
MFTILRKLAAHPKAAKAAATAPVEASEFDKRAADVVETGERLLKRLTPGMVRGAAAVARCSVPLLLPRCFPPPHPAGPPRAAGARGGLLLVGCARDSAGAVMCRLALAVCF